VAETNIVEEDKEQVAGKSRTFTFTLGAYGVKTFRVRFAAAPAAVEGLTAVTTAQSTLTNLSVKAKATASSEYSGEYAASNALSLANGADWAANNQTRATIKLTWDSDVQIGSFALADRPNGADNVQSATVTFSDGSKVEVTDIDPAGKVKTIALEEVKTARWAEVEIRCEKPSNIGLSGLEFYAAGGQAAAVEGTQLTWTAQDDALYYEIFRGTDPDFAAGSGSYLASADKNQYFDAQVPGDLTRTYYYKVRAVAAGAKGETSAAAGQLPESGGDAGEAGEVQLVAPISAIAGSQYSDQNPTLIIDGSGLTGDGLDTVHDNHSNAFTMWHTDGHPGANAWVQLDFDRAYPLDEMWVWNMNQSGNTGRGLKNVRIQYTADGIVWQDLQPEAGMTFTGGVEGYPFQLAQATGQDDMAATNLNDGSNTPIRFGGALAKHVKISAHPDAGTGSWGDVYFGLSEVRFTRKSASQSSLTVKDTAPEVPVVNATPRLGTRVDLDWAPVYDDLKLDHYEIYRDGELIGRTLDAYICTYRDKTAAPKTAYTYTVKAVDMAGNASESAPVSVRTLDSLAATLSGLTLSMGTLTPGFAPETRFYTINLGDNFGRFDGVKVTATAANPAAKIYVNGVETAGGAESALVPLEKPGDKVVVKVVEGEVSKSYILTADTDAPILAAADAIAGSQYDNQKPTLIIDGSGLTGKGLDAVHDNHSSAFTMWHTGSNPGDKAWVQIDLGQSYELDEMWIWNMNQSGNIGRGLKNVKIEYTADGKSWQTLEPEVSMTFADSPAGYPFQFAQASGQNGMPATNLNDGKNTPVRFGGAEARYVKITAHPDAGTGSWGDIYYGLSEVRFTSKLDLRDIVAAESIEVTGEGGKQIITTPGGSLQMTAAIKPDNATRRDVVWSVANPEENVAVISAEGLLTAHSNGSVEVVATAKDGSGVTGRCTVTVSGQPEIITGVTAQAGNVYDEHNTPEKVVNGAGMSGQNSVFDLHDDHGNGNTMWHTKAGPGEDAWIIFDLGRVQAIGQMWIWNMNQRGNADRGLKKVKIEYRSSHDEDWTALQGTGEGEYDFTLAKASGQPDQPATNLLDGRPVEMNLDARYVRITAAPQPGEGNYGSDYYGLSEVRFTAGGSGQSGETLRQALEAADAAVKGLTLSNDTSADQILEAVRQAVAGTGVSVEWKEELVIKPATAAEKGSAAGSLTLTLEGESLALPIRLEIPVLVVPGDMDKNGEVTIQDVMEACKVLARQSAGKAPTDDEMARGDLDGNNLFTITDVMEICKILACKA
ncbi:MAG: hypothetical protein HFE86_04290, partial [Clostridiales bacterium]|nr:hypothetical protein [Clostridiales bacterium]